MAAIQDSGDMDVRFSVCESMPSMGLGAGGPPTSAWVQSIVRPSEHLTVVPILPTRDDGDA